MTTLKVAGVLLGVFGVAVIFSDQLTLPVRWAARQRRARAERVFGSYSNVLVKLRRKNRSADLAASQMGSACALTRRRVCD